MPTRNRLTSSSFEQRNPQTGELQNYGSFSISREFLEEQFVPGGNCVQHVRYLKLVNGQIGKGPIFATSRFNHPTIPANSFGFYCPSEIRERILRNYSSMSVVSKSSFELLPFLFDLDSTIAMFSQKFLRELSYGSIIWGVLPFINDIRSLMNAILNILSGLPTTFQAVSRKRSVVYNDAFTRPRYNGGSFVWNVSGISRCNGTFRLSTKDLTETANRAIFLLDQLGVHPDLKTAWDIIPLSFVVDYFLPIGEILESLHPRGWGSSTVSFKGWFSTKLLCEVAESYFVPPDQQLGINNPSLFTYYERTNALSFSGPDIEWKAPSLKELFNTAYLLTSLKRVF